MASAFDERNDEERAATRQNNNQVAVASTASANYEYYEFKRSRNNTPSSEPNLLDLSHMDLEDCSYNLSLFAQCNDSLAITSLLLNNNMIKTLPSLLSFFANVHTLDLSSNQMKAVDADVCKLANLKNLIIKDNLLEDMSLPKDFAQGLTQLEMINLSGNMFTQFPYQLLSMPTLREIYIGSNKISTLPRNYEQLQRLEIFYLGGNQLRSVPEELCQQLRSLTSLNLSNNQINSLPNIMTKMKKLKNLSLHNNNLTTLPVELVKLNLHELSLRNNPLVRRFAREYSYNVPSLLELSGRAIKTKNVPYGANNLPTHLCSYLNSAQCCLNPKCKLKSFFIC
jgi:Leucine-rich repeat (LRR) protein